MAELPDDERFVDIQCAIPKDALALATLGIVLYIAPNGKKIVGLQPGVYGDDNELKPDFITALGMLEMAKDEAIYHTDEDEDEDEDDDDPSA